MEILPEDGEEKEVEEVDVGPQESIQQVQFDESKDDLDWRRVFRYFD